MSLRATKCADTMAHFGALEDVFRHLDCKMLISAHGGDFLRAGLFSLSSVVAMPNDSPSAEKVAFYCLSETV